jgi:LysM repeat protein
MKTRFTAEVLALAGIATGLVITSGCKTTYSDSADLSLTPMPSSLSPEPGGNITYPTPEAEKPQPYYLAHPEAVAALDKVAAKTPAAPAAAPGYSTYVVKSGESLSKIANAHGFRYVDVLAVNPGIDPNKIRVGQTIVLPAAGTAKIAPKANSGTSAKTASAAGGTYVVQKGDILGRIANKHKVKVADLKKANGLTSDKIVVGQKLIIPGAKSVAKPVSAPAFNPAKPKVAVVDAKSVSVQPTQKVAPAPEAPEVKPVDPPAIVPPTPAPVDPPAVLPDTPAPAPVAEAPKGTPYVVQEGQDLFDISVKWGLSAADIKAFNHLDSDKVVPGQTIMIPPPKAE